VTCLFDCFHWKCYIPNIHQIEKLRFLGISRYTFKLRLWLNLSLYQGIWVSRFGGSPIWNCTEKFEFLDMVDLLGVWFSVESVTSSPDFDEAHPHTNGKAHTNFVTIQLEHIPFRQKSYICTTATIYNPLQILYKFQYTHTRVWRERHTHTRVLTIHFVASSSDDRRQIFYKYNSNISLFDQNQIFVLQQAFTILVAILSPFRGPNYLRRTLLARYLCKRGAYFRKRALYLRKRAL